MRYEELRTAVPHDILVAWQDGQIDYREAMALTACENLFQLYQACRSNGVPLRKTLTPKEREGVERVVAALKSEQ